MYGALSESPYLWDWVSKDVEKILKSYHSVWQHKPQRTEGSFYGEGSSDYIICCAVLLFYCKSYWVM